MKMSDSSLRRGELKFTLFGKKLRVSWVLFRTRGYGNGSDRSWLMIKHRVNYVSTEDIAITEPRSVTTRRLLAEIARDAGGDEVQAATGDPVRKSAARARARTQPRSRSVRTQKLSSRDLP